MGLKDRLTGTRRPDGGVPPEPAAEVRAALLALGGPDVPYTVRNALPAEDADLVAEWRLREPAWHDHFLRHRLERQVQIRMRIDPARHEVRTADRMWEVTWVGGTPRLATSGELSRGQVTTVSKQWTIGRGKDGGIEATESFRFDVADMKTPLQKAVLGAGWTWRGVLFGRL
ncbi:hypothetical protein HYE82_25310 [Streptomyces sp. BR123]|uniref:hypothetical protein n=1 Tax=Streptomyces sp. BR123 TaxID=2749828 RepID=UPI0015C4CFE7|nr:hypothetical protein [Streptomyces sp. BR123]NXY97631.1 hypothetical protein [Streptomyces sp. BR123]